VEFQRFLAVVGGQSVDGVGQGGQGMFHGGFLKIVMDRGLSLGKSVKVKSFYVAL
jgi:hypothetical protein